MQCCECFSEIPDKVTHCEICGRSVHIPEGITWGWRQHVALGIFLTAIVTAVFWLSPWDIAISKIFFQMPEPHWPHENDWIWNWMRQWGPVPGLILGFGAIALWIASHFVESIAHWRKKTLFIGLLFVLGPGLLVNGITKNLGRPRPYQIKVFGGESEYLRPFAIGELGNGASLVSGHASIAFLFFGLAFVCTGRKRRVAFLFAIGFGLLMSITRVVQGAHFSSDVLLAGTLIYTLAAFLSPIAVKNNFPSRKAHP